MDCLPVPVRIPLRRCRSRPVETGSQSRRRHHHLSRTPTSSGCRLRPASAAAWLLPHRRAC
jgi:hypothetical protein